jgi:hypothetical protein
MDLIPALKEPEGGKLRALTASAVEKSSIPQSEIFQRICVTKN